MEAMMFKIGDFVISRCEQFIGLVTSDVREHKGELSWEVYWNDGDMTYCETQESISLYKIKYHDWNIKLIKKHLEVIDECR
tara:strand:- start:185 stop:427 length:243 start_codon:yes stop_codon:yes gene_type:complete